MEKFKRRVEEAEDQLQRVKEDNKELRSQAPAAGAAVSREQCERSKKPDGRQEWGFADDNAELREAKAEAQLLEMRYKQLEENTRAQRDVQKAQFDQLDEYNRRIRDLRRALQDSEADKDKLRLDADRVDELQERVTELQTANRRLEDELLNLSDVALNQDFSQEIGRRSASRSWRGTTRGRGPSSTTYVKVRRARRKLLFNCSSRWMTYELLSRERSTSCSSSNYDPVRNRSKDSHRR